MKNRSAQQLRAIKSDKRIEASRANGAKGGRPTIGRKSKSGTITLTLVQWIKLDKLRRNLTRSKWIAGKIEESKP